MCETWCLMCTCKCVCVPLEVFPYDGEGMLGPYVRDGIASLVGGSVDGIGWAGRPLVIRQGCEGFQCMACKCLNVNVRR